MGKNDVKLAFLVACNSIGNRRLQIMLVIMTASCPGNNDSLSDCRRNMM